MLAGTDPIARRHMDSAMTKMVVHRGGAVRVGDSQIVITPRQCPVAAACAMMLNNIHDNAIHGGEYRGANRHGDVDRIS